MTDGTRKGWLAGVLSFLIPGLGQIYNGQGKKGLLLLALPFLAAPFSCLAARNNAFLSLLSSLLVAVAFTLFAIVDAVVKARRSGEGFRPRRYNRWYVYLGIFILYTALKLSATAYVKANVVQAFKLPAGSMEPTLLIGDHFLVDRSPAARLPKRGDIIVFRFPEDPKKDFVKRVAAVGGDRVEIRDKVLLLNGSPVTEKYVVHSEKDMVPREVNPRDNFGPVTVPPGSFFVLGDNRDRSYDSRFFGPIEGGKVKGTVRSIYWSWNPKSNEIRCDRIGMAVK